MLVMMEDSAEGTKPVVKIYGNSSLLERVNVFQQKAELHKSKQLDNPFSKHEGSGDKKSVDIHDPKFVINNIVHPTLKIILIRDFYKHPKAFLFVAPTRDNDSVINHR